MARKRLPPLELEIERLGKGGAGEGRHPDGGWVRLRPAPPGARLKVVPAGRRKGVLQARRLHVVRPPPDPRTPPCPAFGLCGGCALQEVSVAVQRRHKWRYAASTIPAITDDVVVHEVVEASADYRYRNKVELTFGPSRYLREADHAAGLPLDGRFLGFHALGRFDRVVDVDDCHLTSEHMASVLSSARRILLGSGLSLYAPRTHAGLLRHLVLREGDDGVLVRLFTARPDDDEAEALEPLLHALLEHPAVHGVQWLVNEGVADVARGDLRLSLGSEVLHIALGSATFELSPDAFFQTTTRGAEVLYDVVLNAVRGAQADRVYDLYCGSGSIGIYLAVHGVQAREIVGIESVPAAIEDARRNAVLNEVQAAVRYVAAKVEDQLRHENLDDAVLVVDPPRAGLHPRAARALAEAKAPSLVYVACNPASLGRDAPVLAEGGWRLAEVWPVDLFPQTGHLEVVGRFER